MFFSTDLSETRPFRLSRALLLYEGGNQQAYATVHDVEVKRLGARPTLKAGTPVNNNFITSLLNSLGKDPGYEYFPESILYRTNHAVVWWTPASIKTLFFRADEKTKGLDAEDYPVPPLVWALRRGSLYVRALLEDRRPDPDTPMMIAPFWNTEGNSGNVCQGSMERPEDTQPSNVSRWSDSYFRAQFTHQTGILKLTSHPKGVIGLWRSLKGKKAFPGKYLVPAGSAKQPELLSTFATGKVHHG